MRSSARYGHFMIIPWSLWFGSLEWRSDAFLKGLEGLESGLSEASWSYFIFIFLMLKTGWFDRFWRKQIRSFLNMMRKTERYCFLPYFLIGFQQDTITCHVPKLSFVRTWSTESPPFWWIESCISCARSDSFPLRKWICIVTLGSITAFMNRFVLLAGINWCWFHQHLDFFRQI